MDVPDGLGGLEVLQDGEPLPFAEGCCPLPTFEGNIVATIPDGRSVDLLSSGPPLIFKTAKAWKGPGRRVRRLTRGYFLVIVPADWKREDPPPIAPTDTTVSGYRAHYVYQDGRTNDAVRFAGQAWSMPNAEDVLKGRTVFDDDLDHGPLFVGNCPELRKSKDFQSATIGDEGTPNGWHDSFMPLVVEGGLGDLLEGRKGWFLFDCTMPTPSSWKARIFGITDNWPTSV